MEEERFVLPNFDETLQYHQAFQTHRFQGKKCINVPETVPEHSSGSLGEDNLEINDLKATTECFSSDNKENITSNNSVISDEPTICAMKPFNYSSLLKCEKQLLESSNDEEKSFESEKVPIDSAKLLQLSKKLKLFNDTISTPPSALREQISILRKEMNEAYEFHDLEVQILKEEKKEDSESYAVLIEKYSSLLELYSSLKAEYEEYRREQEKITNDIQSKTVDCLESLCSQIETSDNSFNSASFVSFNTDLKCSTMIDNFTEKETTLLHEVTIQTKDPLSDTDIFKTPKLTHSVNKSLFQNLNQRGDFHNSKYNVKVMEVETALSDKAKELDKLEQRVFKVEDLSGLLQNEFERISMIVEKENETLKQNLSDKSEQLDLLTQKLFTEIISLNPSLTEKLADAPGTKLLPVFIETIMEKCKNMENKLIMKFSIEKSDLEIKVNNLLEENKNLNEQISSHDQALQELKTSYERQLSEIQNMILTRDEEIRILKTHDFNKGQMQEDLASAKEEVTRLETQLSSSDSRKKEMEDKCLGLEKTSDSLRLELEQIKKFSETTENEKNDLKERLSQITTEKAELQDACEKLKQQLSLNEEIISCREEELQNLKNQEMKQMQVALAQADEIILKIKSELFATETEKLNFEKRCLELENINSTLQNLMATKDIILKDLEGYKSSSITECERMTQELKEKEMTLSDLRMELNTLNEKYSMEVKKTVRLNEEISSYTAEIVKQEKSYKDIEGKLLIAESKIQTLEEEIQNLKTDDSNIRKTQEDLSRAKEEVTKLEAQLSLSESCKKEMEDKCLAIEKTSDSLRLELEQIKKFNNATEDDNNNLKERLLQVTTEKGELQDTCEKLKQQLSLNEEIISCRDEELQNLKNQEMKQMEIALAEADEVILKVKAELFATETEKLNFEKRCLELENTNSTLQDQMATKDIILKDLENFKSSSESEWENMTQKVKEKEITISNLIIELDTLKEKYSVEIKEIESLNELINSYMSKLSEKEKLCTDVESKLLDAESKIQTQEEEIQNLKTHNFSIRQLQEDLASAKEEVTRLETQLSSSDSRKKEVEDKCLAIEKTSDSLRLELEQIKNLFETIENENYDLKERLSQITTEKAELQDACEKLKQQLSLNEEIISCREEELQNLKNQEMKQMEMALAQADEVILKIKSELFATETEKLNFEKRCLELENINSTLQDQVVTKDIILRDLESFKSSCQTECERMMQEIREKDMTLSGLRMELNSLNEKYSMEVKNTDCLKEIINSHKSEIAEQEKSYRDLEMKLLDAESKIRQQDEEIRFLQAQGITVRELQDDLASAKEINEKLRAQLLVTESDKRKLEDRCQALEEKCSSLRQNLNKIKSDCTNSEIENENCVKLIHQKNSEFDFEGLFEVLREGLENLKSSSVGDFPKIIKKAMAHVKKLQSRAAELEEENEKLDEECDSYAKVIKDLKKEAAVEWKKTNEKIQAFEGEILKLTEMKKDLEDEKKELLGKMSKLEEEIQRIKTNITPEERNCGCGLDLKKLNELKRTILVKEQKLLELQDMEVQNNSYKSQIEYLKNALDKERKKINEEREKNKKLQNQLNEATHNPKTDNKKFEENQILEELRMRGSISGGVVGEIVDKEKMRKLSKDVGVLKEICRARYAEIKRLEAENAALKNFTPKNSNQVDSPIRNSGYSTRSKNQLAERWKTEMGGKENRAV